MFLYTNWKLPREVFRPRLVFFEKGLKKTSIFVVAHSSVCLYPKIIFTFHVLNSPGKGVDTPQCENESMKL